MITDLFSHKIHSSGLEWQEKLVELAGVFAEFDNQIYDRKAIDLRLQQMSPRATFVARDSSKFRDEISAYPAYLGLYRIELFNNRWIFRLSETAKQYLIVDEPNVSAFMLLQLVLFQYPNGMGISYASNSNKLRIQANARKRTFEFIRDEIHISPLRLVSKAIQADSKLKNISPFDAVVTYKEIYSLANHPNINRKALPKLDEVVEILEETRDNIHHPPEQFESRFHILNHTDLIVSKAGKLFLRKPVNIEDEIDLLKKHEVLNSLAIEFNDFDYVQSEEDFEEIIRQGNYGRYFDSLLTLNSETIKVLANDSIFDFVESIPPKIEHIKTKPAVPPITYPLKERSETLLPSKPFNKRKQFIDPEITRIKRQRSNLSHKLILQKLDEYLRTLGSTPFENEHIDLFAQIPFDGSFLFEVKSLSYENLLSQTRKGLSQLYEYRFRYKNQVGDDVTLCLVFPREPSEIDWLQEYLCIDRDIAVLWFEENGSLGYSPYCKDLVKSLINIL